MSGPPTPGPQQAGWGSQGRYPNAVRPAPKQRPPQWSTRPPGGPPRRRRRLAVVLAVVGVLVVGGVVIGIVFAVSGTTQHGQSGQVATPTEGPSGAGTGSAAQARATIARNAETVVHGLGNGRPGEFCPLIDRTDLSRLLREKHLGKCADIKLTTQTNHADYQSFTVTDPSAIQINGDTADIPATAITPATFGTVEMRENGDGAWKFRFFAS